MKIITIRSVQVFVWRTTMKKYILLALLLAAANFSYSEDIELYISESVKQSKSRPQVLIIFDDSGSMSTNETVKASYNPQIAYDALGGLSKLAESYTYYTQGEIEISDIPKADESSEKRKFLSAISNCKTAQDIIDKYGFYTGYVREYKFQGNSGRWVGLNENDGSNIIITDCQDDVISINNNNNSYLNNSDEVITPDDFAGYPIDGEGSSSTPVFYAANIADTNVSWSGSLVTLYSDNYLRWYHGDVNNVKIGWETKERMEIAQESVVNLIYSAPNVDFGLQVFNYNYKTNERNGGRIVFGITESTIDSRATLKNVINDAVHAQGNTPLCESLYEASRYFAGKSVDFGNDDQHYSSHGYTANVPSRDTSIESSGVYQSPLSSCSDKAYVILITDGQPTMDTDADAEILAMPSGDQEAIGSPFELNGTNNYLAALAGWMNNNDINDNLDGKQTVETYTIGFGEDAQEDAEPLLKEAAALGGGKYFPTQDTASLTAALINLLANISPSNDSLTSASVAANNFDRTETLNAVYYAMFQPDRGPRWQGNLKKYNVVNGKQLGQNGNTAIDDESGHFSPDATSFWSSDKDGNRVAEGGVAAMLRKKTNRTIYSETDDGESLALLNEDVLSGNEQAFADLVGIDVDDALEYFKWNLGIDVDDEDEDGARDDMRHDIFGDPLHSKPLVLNYGNKIHVVIGTNAGALHLFKDTGNTVDETWAFMPKELFPNIKKLRDNDSSDDKVYGIDGRITSYIDDKDGDGIIETGDKVWIFFGLRRGGSSYYGLDISQPDSPSLLWHIGADDLAELGQSWSQPKLAFSKINIEHGIAKPVLIFGGGYDTSKDNDGVGQSDNIGRAVYMVDAETGILKWSMAPEGASTSFDGVDSIPSTISTLDSDADGLADRLYFGDTGGNVWRVDMPSDSPTGEDPWSVFKLAELGNANDNTNDRRFFNEPSIVRTFITETLQEQVTDSEGQISTVYVYQETPYDAVLLGSGDRSKPLNDDTDDMFFMIKDKYVQTRTFAPEAEQAKPAAIVLSTLYDISDNPLEQVNDAGRQALEVELSSKSGWFFSLEQLGEKSTASAIVINNTVYFTTFTPPNLDSYNEESCELPNGQGWLYGVELAQGISKFKWSEEESNREDRIAFISEQFLGSPTLIVIPQDDGDSSTIDESVGNLIVGRRMIDVGFKLQTMRTYLYVTEER